MIVDKLCNINRYSSMCEELRSACDWLGRVDISTLPNGKNLLDGDRVYANVSHGCPEPWEDRQFEGHRDYIDVQCVLSGDETMGYACADSAAPCHDYDSATDLTFFQEPACSSRLQLSSGMFAVFFPEDAHKPNCRSAGEQSVHKVVLKVKLSTVK